MSDFESESDYIPHKDSEVLGKYEVPESDFTFLDDDSDLIIYQDGVTADDVNSALDIEIIEPRRHEQFPALIRTIFDLKEKLDRFVELYGCDINKDGALDLLVNLARYVDGLNPENDDLSNFWIDYSKANAVITKIEKEIASADKVVTGAEADEQFEKKRYFPYKSNNKFTISGFPYIFREDNHGSTSEHKGLHFALENKNEVELGIVVTMGKLGKVHLEPHGDKKKGNELIGDLFEETNIEKLQMINDFTKYKFGEKPIDKRRKFSRDSIELDDGLAKRYFFERGY